MPRRDRTTTDELDNDPRHRFLGASARHLTPDLGCRHRRPPTPETLSRVHAITAPHVLGTLLAMLGLALRLREPAFYGLLLIAAVFHMATTAIVCHMIGRASYRARKDRKERLIVDELASPLDREVPQDPPQPDAS